MLGSLVLPGSVLCSWGLPGSVMGSSSLPGSMLGSLSLCWAPWVFLGLCRVPWVFQICAGLPGSSWICAGFLGSSWVCAGRLRISWVSFSSRSSYTCRFFILPCCFFDFVGRYCRRQSRKTQYREYLDFVLEVGLSCGFHMQEDCLRIPSTKRVCAKQA